MLLVSAGSRPKHLYLAVLYYNSIVKLIYNFQIKPHPIWQSPAWFEWHFYLIWRYRWWCKFFSPFRHFFSLLEIIFSFLVDNLFSLYLRFQNALVLREREKSESSNIFYFTVFFLTWRFPLLHFGTLQIEQFLFFIANF